MKMPVNLSRKARESADHSGLVDLGLLLARVGFGGGLVARHVRPVSMGEDGVQVVERDFWIRQ